MKKMFLLLFIFSFSLIAEELPCPTDSVIYLDTSEGGPGFYCTCPQENIVFDETAIISADNNGYICVD